MIQASDTMTLPDLPGEFVERGIWWQIGGFAVVSAVGVALLVEFGGSETRAYRYFEAAVRTMYWANVFVLIGLFEGVRRMFEKASTLRARYWEQAEKRATERGLKRGLKRGIERGREEARTRMQQALERFGVEVNGVRMLPDTPEVQKFLDGEAD